MLFEVKDNNPLLKNFIYTFTLPKLIDPAETSYPKTVFLPVINTEIDLLNDEWILRMWECNDGNDKGNEIEIMEKQIDKRIIIDLSLFHTSYDFRAICSLKFCTCEKSIDSGEQITDNENNYVFKNMSIGSIGATICLDPDDIKKHINCYGYLYKLIVYITIPKCDIDKNKVVNLIKNPNNLADEFILSDDNPMNFTIIIDDEKFILNVKKWSQASPFFHVLFCKMKNINLNEYILKGIHSNLFRIIWIWIERNRELKASIDIEQTIELASLLQINILIKCLETVLLDSLSRDNWQKKYLVADKLDLQELRVESLLVGKIQHTEGKFDEVKNFDLNILYYFYDKNELINIMKPYFEDSLLKTDIQMILPIQHDSNIHSI